MKHETFVPLYINNFCHSSCKICNYNVDNKELKRYCASIKEIEKQLDIIYDIEKISAVCILTGEFIFGKIRRENFKLVIETIEKAFLKGFEKVYFNIGSLYDEEISILKDRFISRKNSLVLSLFQETYDREIYDLYFASNKNSPKSNFDFRLSTPERWVKAGFNIVDIGILVGINKYIEQEIISLSNHIIYLEELGASVCVSLPRVKGHLFQNKVSNDLYFDIIKSISQRHANIKLIITTRETNEFIKKVLPYVRIVSPGSSDLIPYTEAGKLSNKIETSQFVVKEKRDRPSEILDEMNINFHYYKGN